MITYNELLNNMQNSYYEKCGERLDLNSPCGARVQAVASELFSVACFGDYVLKQAFVQTATGEYLDNHARLRDIVRKQPTKSTGVLTFMINEEQEQDILIPKNTVCCVTDSPYLQYATDEDAVLVAGGLGVDVPATAIESGENHNVSAGTITTMVNPPASIASVTNNVAFEGGFEQEFDNALRSRIMSSYAVPASGFNEQSLIDSVLTIDEVFDCKMYQYNRILSVYVKIKGSKISAGLQVKILDKLFVAKLSGLTIAIKLAHKQKIGLVVEVHTKLGKNDMMHSQITEAIENIVKGLRVGENLNLSRIYSAVSAVEGVDYCDVTCPSAVGNKVICLPGSYIYCDDCKVTYYE